MSVSRQQVQPAVVIIVQEFSSPTQKRKGDGAQSGLLGYFHEIQAAVVVLQGIAVVRKRGEKEVIPSIVIVVTHGHAHVRLRASVRVGAQATHPAYFLKSAVAPVVINEIRSGVV